MKDILKRLAVLIATAVFVTTAQAQPATAPAHLKKGTTPPTVLVGKAAFTNSVTFDKESNLPFAIVWDAKPGSPAGAPARTPCSNGTINNKNPKCVFNANVCKIGGGDGDGKCHFKYHTADGDPEIIIDEGNNPPPPKAAPKGKKATTP